MWNPQRYVTRVPIDDFVVGDLPMVCARTGRPADGLVGVESPEGTFRGWWLLLLILGPLGIVAIVLLWALARRPGRVGGSIPMTSDALDEQNRAIGWANWCLGVPILAFVGGVALLASPVRGFGWLPFTQDALGGVLLVVAFVGGVASMAVTSTLANRRRVTVRLDGSGRWVEIHNVHGDFARAVDRQVRQRHASRHDTARRDASR